MHGQAVGLVHPEDVAWVSEHLRRALAENQGTVSFEYRIVRRDGAVVWLLISAGLSQEDGGMVLSGMILDITARKAMEDRLRRSEERFQIAVRQAGISVWEYDIPARRLYSSVSTQGHGEACPVVEQVPQSLIDSGYVHPSGVKEFQGMHEALHRGEPTASCVVQVRSPRGATAGSASITPPCLTTAGGRSGRWPLWRMSPTKSMPSAAACRRSSSGRCCRWMC